jgi:hypothetical protein
MGGWDGAGDGAEAGGGESDMEEGEGGLVRMIALVLTVVCWRGGG